MHLIGDVKDKNVIIIDDILDSAVINLLFFILLYFITIIKLFHFIINILNNITIIKFII